MPSHRTLRGGLSAALLLGALGVGHARPSRGRRQDASPSASTCRSPAPTRKIAELHQGRRADGDRRGQRRRAASPATRSSVMHARRRHRDRRPVRPGAGRDQRPQDGRRHRRSSPLSGPQMSGSGKAMSPILSARRIWRRSRPSSTNPDITNPKFAAQYRPAGKAIYFRTVTTDAFQGPNMANYFADNAEGEVGLHPRRQRRLRRRASPMRSRRRRKRAASKVLGHDQLEPEGGRLHDHPDQDQVAQPRRALLRRRRPGRGQGRQAVLRHHPEHDQRRRRRRLRRRRSSSGAGFPAARAGTRRSPRRTSSEIPMPRR